MSSIILKLNTSYKIPLLIIASFINNKLKGILISLY
jgi:hypothetical protein